MKNEGKKKLKSQYSKVNSTKNISIRQKPEHVIKGSMRKKIVVETPQDKFTTDIIFENVEELES